ncbi:MAG: DUF4384 domain-containing protein [Lentisphaerae bacterium]|nr:DUF4384 domain-containing protein [Lentisphaerota bacterium]
MGCGNMLLIKKITSDSDIELIRTSDPGVESRIFVLRQQDDKNFFHRMNPLHKSEQSSLLGLKKRSRWHGGYYVANGGFELDLSGQIKALIAPRPLLAAMRLAVTGFNLDEDVSELVRCMQNDELTSEELNKNFARYKDRLFYELEKKLYADSNSGSGSVQSVSTPSGEITDMMLKVMTGFFPCLQLSVSFAEITEQLSEAEIRARRDAEELARQQQQYNQKVAEEQAASSHRQAMEDIAENERELDYVRQLQDLDRKRALQAKAEEIKSAGEESAVKRAEITLKLEKIAAERQNIQVTIDRENKVKDAIAEVQINQAGEKAGLEIELLKAQLRKEQLSGEKLVRELQQIAANPTMERENRYIDYRICNIERQTVPNGLIKIIEDQSLGGRHVEITKAGVQKSTFQPRGMCMEKCEEDIIQIGCKMEVRFQSDRTGYLTMLCIDSAGSIDVIMPNCLDKQVRIAAGGNYIIPAPDGSLLKGVKIRQTGPAGRERLAVIVSEEPLLPTPQGNGFASLDGNELAELQRKLRNLPAESWSGGYITYTVQAAE